MVIIISKRWISVLNKTTIRISKAEYWDIQVRAYVNTWCMKFHSNTHVIPCGLCPPFPHSFLLFLPNFPVVEEVDYGAITGIHIGEMFDTFHSKCDTKQNSGQLNMTAHNTPIVCIMNLAITDGAKKETQAVFRVQSLWFDDLRRRTKTANVVLASPFIPFVLISWIGQDVCVSMCAHEQCRIHMRVCTYSSL